MTDWQPIETAPKDSGTDGDWVPVLVYVPKYGVQIAHYDDDGYAKKPRPYWAWSHLFGVLTQRACQPTHWMPLPAEPQP